jgi:methyl coenzyme M reductase system subunit A2
MGTDETFILVSHDMDFVRDTCHQLALMQDEKIISVGYNR